MSEELYVVRCSIVGPELPINQMPLEEAQQLADYLNSEGRCVGNHTVVPVDGDEAQDR